MKNKKNYNIISNIFFILKHSYKWDKTLFLLLLLNTFVTALLPFPSIYLSKYIINNMDNVTSSSIVFFVNVFFLIILSFSLTFLSMLFNALIFPRINYIRTKFMLQIGKVTSTIKYELNENQEILDLSERTARAWECIDDGIAGIINDIFKVFPLFLSLIIYISIFSSIDSKVVFFIFIAVIMKYFFSLIFGKIDHKYDKKMNPYNRKMDYYNEILNNKEYIKHILTLNLYSNLFNDYKDALDSNFKIYKKKNRNIFLRTMFFSFISCSLSIFLYSFFLKLKYNNILGIDDFVYLIALAVGFSSSIENLILNFAHMINQNHSVNDFRTYCGLNSDYDKNFKKDIIKHDVNIKFENVSFSYNGDNNLVLDNMSFEINNSEKIAFVGLNGSGKTTIIKLLLKFYDNYNGNIYINNVNIRNIDKENLYDVFSVVFQDVHLFSFPLEENIALSFQPDINKINNILSSNDLFNDIKNKYNLNDMVTKLFDDDGIELSGGEIQKIALLRALYKGGLCYIFDEPSSNLDAISEYELYSNISKICNNKTLIYVSHRISSTMFCDKIFMVKDGKIIEEGTPQDLIQKRGDYYEMYNKQMSFYK